MEQLTITLGTTLGARGKIKEMNVFGSIARFVPLFLYIPLFALGAQPYWLYIIIFINFGLIINGYTLYLTKKYCDLDINYFSKNVFFPCLGSTLISLAIGFCSYLFLDESFLRLLFSTFLSLSSYFACMLFFVFNEDEKVIIKRLRDKFMNHSFRK